MSTGKSKNKSLNIGLEISCGIGASDEPITIELKLIIEPRVGGGCDLDHSANQLRSKDGMVPSAMSSLAKSAGVGHPRWHGSNERTSSFIFPDHDDGAGLGAEFPGRRRKRSAALGRRGPLGAGRNAEHGSF